jgi:predicted nuclease with TOPRIM domain
MSSRKSKELFEAIFFFGKKSIVKEMRYSEFEAVLDGVVGITELANKEVNAAYLKINSSLQVHSVVTFQVEFNAQGFADEDWNIPLRHLAENAGPGPDLGGGPIRLACRSQCSVSWYQRELWEPNQREINHFQLVIDAVKRNKLGLITEDDDIPLMTSPPVVDNKVEAVDVPLMSDTVDVPTLEPISHIDQSELNQKLEQQAGEFQKKVDLLISRQKQTLQGIDEKYKDEIDQVKRAMRNEAQSYRHRAQDLEQQANQNKVLLEKLQSLNSKLEREHIRLQEQAESQKEQYDHLKDEYLELLRNQRSAEDDKSKQIIHLKEELTEKSIELSELQEALTGSEAQNTELSERVEGYQQQVHESNSTNTSEIKDLNNRLEQKQNELASLKANLTTLESEKSRLTKQNTLVSSQADDQAAKLEEISSLNAQLKESLKKLEFKNQDLEQKLRESSDRNEKLAQDLSEIEETVSDSSDVFERMEKMELVFVAYHPGAGHISLPARQLEDYLEKPMAFAAQKCSVTVEQYKSWLLHYDNSECEECSVPVKRIDSPSDFQPGINNRCSKHRLAGENVAMFRKTS